MSNTITSTHDADVAHIVKVLLADRELRQSDLAAELDFDGGTMSRALNGKRKWTVEEIKRIADYFNVSLDVLLGDPRHLVRSRCFSHGIDQLELFANNPSFLDEIWHPDWGAVAMA